MTCPGCGHVEEDGEGLPPKPLRDQLLTEGGRWRLALKDGDRVAVIKTVKSAFGLSLKEASAAARMFPTVYIGTKTEVEWLKLKLEASSAVAQVTPAL